jgi:Fe-S cluster assembly scaffold protein SufB
MDAGVAAGCLSPLADDGRADWARVEYPKIDFNDLTTTAAPKSAEAPKTIDDVDPELLRTYEKLGIPLASRKSSPACRNARSPSTRCSIPFRW